MTEDSINFRRTPFKAMISDQHPGQLRFCIKDDDGICYLTYRQVRELRIFLEAAEPLLKKRTQTAKFRELFHELGYETMKAFIEEWKDR